MQVLLNSSTYTELNTVADSFMIQNTSGSPIIVTASAAVPNDSDSGFILQAGDKLTNADYAELLHAKSTQLTGSCEVVG